MKTVLSRHEDDENRSLARHLLSSLSRRSTHQTHHRALGLGRFGLESSRLIAGALLQRGHLGFMLGRGLLLG